MTHIYALSDESGSIRYIGITEQKLLQRLHRHVSKAKTSPTTRTARWIRSMAPERPTIHCLLQVEKHEAADAEKQFIAAMREAGVQLTNSTDGGCGTPGRVHTRESIEARAAKMRGRKHSDESRALMSLAQKGKPRDPASVRKSADTQRGKKRRPCTEEEKRQKSETLKASLADPAIRAAMSQRRLNEWAHRKAGQLNQSLKG